ncbi:MDR family MFS transporter [Dinghuibacter silviterrae]|uniref:Putative MFS family arabinose efflux permease n=1 Tax=Dinghuibacter silviterrae TaxID=1539049 RepID=A0A4R8DFS0_9BACT|nr:MFS transporter [Dinghuibacter silviterrae]TDW96287.1 putative MFS family arabinose efflux permease [Dinghuibacter silviterrae]
MFRQILRQYQNAYSGLSRPIWIQATIMLINRSGTMVIPFLTVYLTSALHFTIPQAGIVLSVFGAGAILGVYLGGKLTDSIGFFPVQFWSLFSNGLLFLGLCYLRGFWTICGCVFLLATIGESFRPANAAATAYYSKADNRTRSYSLNRLAVNLGFAVGPAVGGLLAGISYTWLFWTDGLTCIAAALALRWSLKPAEGKGPTKEKATDGPVQSPYRDKTFVRFVFYVWVFALSFFQLFSVIPLYYQRNLHLTSSQIGLVLSMNGLIIALVEMVLVYRLENRRPDTVYIGYGALLNASAFVVLGVCGPYGWVAVASMLLFTVGEMMSMPFMNAYWISRSTPQSRGQYAAFYGMAFSAAQVVGPSLGAQIAGLWGFQWLWGILVGVGILNFWGFRRLGWRPQKAAPDRAAAAR